MSTHSNSDMTKPRALKSADADTACRVFHLDGRWGNLCVASEKIGFPFTHNVDATIDNIRNSPCEIVIKNHEDASGKLWRALRDYDFSR